MTAHRPSGLRAGGRSGPVHRGTAAAPAPPLVPFPAADPWSGDDALAAPGTENGAASTPPAIVRTTVNPTPTDAAAGIGEGASELGDGAPSTSNGQQDAVGELGAFGRGAPAHREESRGAEPPFTTALGSTQARTFQSEPVRDAARRSVAVPLALAVGSPGIAGLGAAGLVWADPSLVPLALAGVAAGMGLGALGVAGVWRRLRTGVDEPLRDLRTAVAHLDADEAVETSVDVRTGPLRPLADDLRAVGSRVRNRTDRLHRRAEWGERSRMIFEALELADGESEAFEVVGDALALMDPEQSVELLMAPRGTQRLHAVAENPMVDPPGCMVDSLEGCVAIRRGQVVIAESSESINACPQLRGRPRGACSAACVPVTVAGQPIGVVHAVGEDRMSPDPELVNRLSAVAGQVGSRVGALRLLESSREEAATDGLTGLPNRRVVEAQLEQLLNSGTEFVAVLADLDKFKLLNDTYGHEAGDKALQLFARVMQDNVRGHDVVARVGGEEFVVVYPNMSVLRSIEAIERLRTALSSALAVSGLQPFTCSFGVTHSSVASSVLEVLRVADAGLLRAKELGGDQVVYADRDLVAEVFGGGEHVERRGSPS